MRDIRLPGLLLAVLSYVAWASVLQAGQPLSVALIAEEDSVETADVLAAQLFEALSERQDVQFVERERVRDVLTEHALSLSGSTRSETMIEAGRLIAADLFVFLEAIDPGHGNQTLIRQRIVESRTGILLHEHLAPAAELIESHEALAEAFDAAAVLARLAERDRRYVGILGVQREDTQAMTATEAAAMTSFLAHDVTKMPGVLVLERDHLRRLLEEAALTDLDQQLKAATLLVEVGVRRAGEDRLRLTMRVAPLGAEVALLAHDSELLGGATTGLDAGAARHAHVEVAAAEVARMREAIAAAVAELLATAPPASELDPQQEALVFERRAFSFSAHREHELALGSMEAAHALAPSEERMLWRKTAVLDYLRELTWQQQHVEEPEEREALRDRRLELVIEHVTSTTETASRDLTRRRQGIEARPVGFLRLSPRSFVTNYLGNDETLLNDARLRQPLRTYHNVVRGLTELHHERNEDRQFVSSMRELLAVEAMLPEGEIEDQTRLAIARHWIETFAVGVEAGWITNVGQRSFASQDLIDRSSFDDPAEADALAVWMTKHPLLVVRVAGWDILRQRTGSPGFEAAEEVMRLVLFEGADLWTNEEGYQRSSSYSQAVYKLRRTRRWESTVEPVLLEAIERGVPGSEHIVAWTIDTWFDRITGLYLDDVAPILERPLPEQFDEALAPVRRTFEMLRDRQDEVRDAAPWDLVAMRLVDLNAPEGMHSIAAAAVDENDRLIVVWSNHKPEVTLREHIRSHITWAWDGEPRLLATRVKLSGELVTLAEGALRLPPEREAGGAHSTLGFAVNNVALSADTILLATRHELIIFHEGQMRVRGGEHGMPAGQSREIASLHGRFYLSHRGHDASRLVRYCPYADVLDVLASSRSVERRTPFDGAQPFSIHRMIPEPEHNQLRLVSRGRVRLSPPLRYELWRLEVAGPDAEDPLTLPDFHLEAQVADLPDEAAERRLGPFMLGQRFGLGWPGQATYDWDLPQPIEGWAKDTYNERWLHLEGTFVDPLGPGVVMVADARRRLLVVAMPEDIEHIDLPLGPDPRDR